MAQKWNLQDIVPPDRQRKSQSVPPRAKARMEPPQEPLREQVAHTEPPVRAPRKAPSSVREISRGQVREIQPPREEPVFEEHEQIESVDEIVSRLEVTDGRLARTRRYIFAGVAVVLIMAVGLITTILLSGAEVTITPKVHTTSVQQVFEAKLKPAVGELGYDLLTLEESAERQVKASGQEEVSTLAEGTITIFNAYSTTPQRLKKNTRFETPNGLVYRISDSVVIPGYKKDASGTLVPGSIAANVFADGAGETYNVTEDMRLTVPGLKGSDQFDLMYGEVKKDGVKGGFEGKRFIIDETELATTKQKIQTELRDKLLQRVTTERPNGFTLYNQAISFSFESLPTEEAGDGAALIKERVLLHVPLFSDHAFASYIAKNAVPQYGGELVRIENPNGLSFSYEPVMVDDLSKKESITFRLSGQVTLIWKYDEEKLKKDLRGISEDALPTILAQYTGIDKAQAVIRPLWTSRFPDSVEEITVHEVLPEKK